MHHQVCMSKEYSNTNNVNVNVNSKWLFKKIRYTKHIPLKVTEFPLTREQEKKTGPE